jgi:site-specific DNA-methyltransferase (adenine-specific)
MNLYKKSDIPSHLQQYFTPAEIGLEETPDAYVARLVDVFREVRRVLTDDGSLWLNIGDSYAGAGYSNHQKRYNAAQKSEGGKQRHSYVDGFKNKDLIGIPWMLAFALRANGWYLRQDIVWHKPNPMPESVRDRCTKAHEYVFLLTKSQRYFYDHEAVKEPAAYADSGRASRKRGDFAGKNVEPGKEAFRAVTETRNKRSVWTVAPRPYAGAHFAVYPPELIVPCIEAGCPKGGVVLDPFGGSGTTGGVALARGRNALMLELNPEYAALMPDRAANVIASLSRRSSDGAA